jgi:hypothetical protein
MRAERRHVRRHEALACLAALPALLAGCGGIRIQPEPKLPHALVEPLPADVALVLPRELRDYTHKETRWDADWLIVLGPGDVHLMQQIFAAEFRQVQEFPDLAAARTANVQGVFEPRIDQYSFLTANDTGGRYYAATIRYRIDLFTPQGERCDTLTLTGYGSALAKGMSSGHPLEVATLAAMRDAAAKFLVQFPEQPAGVQLAHGQALVLAPAASSADAAHIDAVPIEEEGPEVAPSEGAAPQPKTPAGAASSRAAAPAA